MNKEMKLCQGEGHLQDGEVELELAAYATRRKRQDKSCTSDKIKSHSYQVE